MVTTRGVSGFETGDVGGFTYEFGGGKCSTTGDLQECRNLFCNPFVDVTFQLVGLSSELPNPGDFSLGKGCHH
jgi:hypothetical protein